jgi:predicted helicase
LEDYKRGLHEKKLNLDDDFIKFLRWAHDRIERTGSGIVGFITNNVYLDGLTHRRMRESLLETFDEIYVFNLHGSAKKQEIAPDGTKDDNVFDIMVRVAIALFVKLPSASLDFHGNGMD